MTDYLRSNAEKHPAKTAIVFDGESLNWLELKQAVEQASDVIYSYLSSDKPAVVALLLPNSIDFVVMYLAIVHLGHIAFPLDPAYKKLELDAIVDEFPLKLLITDAHYGSELGAHKVRVETTSQIMRASSSMKAKLLRLPPTEQIASMTFTSGTTGKPKAVPNTHANHIWNIASCSKVWSWTSEDSLLVSLPLSHWYGIVMGLSGCIYHGNTMYLQPWFDEQETLEALDSGKISFFTHISQAYLRLAQADGSYNLSALRLCVSGGAPLPPEVWRKFKRRFGVEILETYGSSETGRIAANSKNAHRLGSPGKLLPQVEMRLSKAGEVQIKSPGVFPGYFRNASATKKASTSDGYFRTGDIAKMQDEYLYLKGRSTEQIRRFGYSVSPRDVEWAMHQQPGIEDIYVVGKQIKGLPNDELIYFVVGSASDSDIKKYCSQNLIFAWRPDRIMRLGALPKTPSGKPKVAEFRRLAGIGD